MAEAEGLGTSSSSCPCGRHWRPSRDSSVLHALARLPDRLASRRHSVCLGGNPCRGFRGSTVNDAPRGCARRSTPACEPRAAALAVAPFARLELAREGRASADPATDTGCRHRKSRAPSFFRRQSGVGCCIRCQDSIISNSANAIDSLRTCKGALSGITIETQNVLSLGDHVVHDSSSSRDKRTLKKYASTSHCTWFRLTDEPYVALSSSSRVYKSSIGL